MCAHKRVRPGIDETMRFSCILESSAVRFDLSGCKARSWRGISCDNDNRNWQVTIPGKMSMQPSVCDMLAINWDVTPISCPYCRHDALSSVRPMQNATMHRNMK